MGELNTFFLFRSSPFVFKSERLKLAICCFSDSKKRKDRKQSFYLREWGRSSGKALLFFWAVWWWRRWRPGRWWRPRRGRWSRSGRRPPPSELPRSLVRFRKELSNGDPLKQIIENMKNMNNIYLTIVCIR